MPSLSPSLPTCLNPGHATLTPTLTLTLTLTLILTLTPHVAQRDPASSCNPDAGIKALAGSLRAKLDESQPDDVMPLRPPIT